MKTDRYNIEVLLSEVEHAGRDARRQQELGEMIDRMAGVPSAQPKATVHGTWWWISRVAAAACVLFFVVTAVRIWFIPTDSGAPMVAEAEVPKVVLPTEVQEPITAVPAKAAVRRDCRTVTLEATEEQTVESVAVEEYFAEEAMEEPLPVEDTERTPLIIEIVDEPMSLSQTADVPASMEEAPVKPAEPAKPVRRSIFSTLFRPAEPSLMEGTTLALLQF